MKIKITALLLTLLMVFSLFGCSDKNGGSNDVAAETTITDNADPSTSNNNTSKFTNFNAKGIDGNDVSSDVFKNSKLTVVNIWATFCGPCIGEMPALGELSQEYKDKDVSFIGIVGDTINFDGSTNTEIIEKAKTIIKDTGASYTHLIPDSGLISLINSIGGYPATFFVDSNGNVIGDAIYGSGEKEDWIGAIDEALAKVNS